MSASQLAEYRKDAISRAEKRIASRILNDSLEHANILIETMIGYAAPEDEIRIYSGHLPESSFAEHLKSAKARKILIALDDPTKVQWLSKLPSDVLAKIEVRRIVKERPNHFFCVSSGAFRFEVDAASYRAEANFNEPETVKKLESAFDGYWADAAPVELQSNAMAQNAS